MGIDIGTTGCKAASFTDSGRMLAYAYREYPVVCPQPGWMELDSHGVWARVREVIGAVARESAADAVAALCVSSMGEAMVPLDEKGAICGPGILGGDTRGGAEIARIADTVGRERWYRICPGPATAHCSLAKILWLRQNDPALFSQTRMFVGWDGLVGALLGARPFMCHSSAARTQLFDLDREEWSEELLGAAHLARSYLPMLCAAGTIMGPVSAAACDELGLAQGAVIVAGGHDQCCNALGAGVLSAGRAIDGIGTFECIAPVFSRPAGTGALMSAGLNLEHHVVTGLYTSFIYNQAGSLVRWFRDTFATAQAADPGIYDRLSAEMPAGPSGLTVLPYFEPSGAPGFVEASGVIAGLTTATTRGHILKGIMEGATYYFVEHLATLRTMGVDTSEFIATGGGARSDAWLQIKADITGVPYTRLSTTECGVTGAALLAGTATGVFASLAEGARTLVRRDRTFEPDRSTHEQYRSAYGRYASMCSRSLPALI